MTKRNQHVSSNSSLAALRQRPKTRQVAFALALVAILILSMALWRAAPSAFAAECSQILTNGDMESRDGWQTTTNGSYDLFSDYQFHTGSQSVYLAGVNNAQDSLVRTISMPADKSVTLRFWWLVNSEEGSGGWDGLSVLVADANGTPLTSLFAISDQNSNEIWQEALFDLSDYAGQTVQIQFNAKTDGTLTTDFFIDDVSVTACGGIASGLRLFLPYTQRQ